MKIVKVNGEDVRAKYYADFVAGGNPARYTFIPRDEIWVEDVKDQKAETLAAIHELSEYMLMSSGLSYSDAHDKCLKIETRLRGCNPLPEEEATQ